jgi:hypothetical protein
MKIDCIIGIDPGASGGITIYRPNNKEVCQKIPKDINDFRDFINHYKDICSPLVFIEKVQMHRGDAQGGKMFGIEKLIKNLEALKTTLEVLDVPFILVHPGTWQSVLKLKIPKEEKPARKKRYKEIAQKYYPDLKATMWNCDATLIMHFGRTILRNNVKWVLENLPQRNHEKLF